jgi:hypothetical protein
MSNYRLTKSVYDALNLIVNLALFVSIERLDFLSKESILYCSILSHRHFLDFLFLILSNVLFRLSHYALRFIDIECVHVVLLN